MRSASNWGSVFAWPMLGGKEESISSTSAWIMLFSCSFRNDSVTSQSFLYINEGSSCLAG